MRASATSPRPILKRSPSSVPSLSSAPQNDSELPFYGIQTVHFPPSPSLSRFYSAPVYDRSPVVVSPNACALPERGCPGRTYTLDDRNSSACSQAPINFAPPPRGGHFHPRVFSQRPAQIPQHCPPLIPDLSSESEESDGLSSPPPEIFISSSYPRPTQQLSLDNTVYLTTKLDSVQSPSSADSRWKSRRIRTSSVVDVDPGYNDSLPSLQPPPVSPRRRCKKSLSSKNAGFTDPDGDGCLGGF
jgi:hypothetical protein